jgi:hypothetical protein
MRRLMSGESTAAILPTGAGMNCLACLQDVSFVHKLRGYSNVHKLFGQLLAKAVWSHVEAHVFTTAFTEAIQQHRILHHHGSSNTLTHAFVRAQTLQARACATNCQACC